MEFPSSEMEGHMRHVYVAVVVLALVLGGGVLGPSGAGAQTVGWQHFGGDPGDTHWSALEQITTSNVRKLTPVWVLQLGTLRSQESTPLVIGDTLYVTSSFGPAHVFAVDARTGELRWRHDPEIAADVDPYGCCDVNNRGLAYANGKIFVGLLDGRLRALDARTGQMLWTSTVVDYKQGSVITSPPVVAKNNVVIGFGGGEYGARGALQAFNADTGALVWRTYLTPEPGEPGSETWKGDSWKTGGGAAWAIGSYDPEQNLIFYGTSNPGPWNAAVRGPDKSDYGRFTNLYTSASVALDGDTGKIAWHYQSTPHDAWDYDGVNELLVADFEIGKPGPGGFMGEAIAWDPAKQEAVWRNKEALPYVGGMLATAGGLVFHGNTEGWFKALDQKNGELLWKFLTGSGISAGPMTYMIDGKQYVAVVSGRTHSIPPFFGETGRKMMAASAEGGALFVFALSE